MGRRGPAPLPMATKAARGTLQRCRVNVEEPQLSAPTSLDPPRDLKSDGRAYWLAHVQELVAKGVLRDVDLMMFESCCRAWSMKRQLERQLAKLGISAAIATGINGALLKWTDKHKQLAAEVGLSPSSRSKVRAVERKAPGTVEKFLRRVK